MTKAQILALILNTIVNCLKSFTFLLFFFMNGLRGYASREPQTVAVVADVVGAVAVGGAVIVGEVVVP